jgi:hypothetical protein
VKFTIAEKTEWAVKLSPVPSLAAVVTDVLDGKKFITTDPEAPLTGTLALNGDAQPEDVVSGKTFYNKDPSVQQTGTLALTGNATPQDVTKDKTFYGTDPKTKLTGTHLNPTVFVDVLSGKPVINLKRADPNNKAVLST